MDGCTPKPEILNQLWYLLDQPWAHSNDAGMTILAGSEDPHRATIVCDLQPMWEEESFIDNATARMAAKYIVDLHNDRLKQMPGRDGTPSA